MLTITATLRVSTDQQQRRREQNRSSQRAYRERKEKHQRELEGQIADWQHKHQQLARTYSQQTDEVKRLKRQIENLNTEITSLQNGLPSLCGSMSQSPTEFDLVPFFDIEPMSPSSPRMRHSSYGRM
jgi:AP-1-like transcription factor